MFGAKMIGISKDLSEKLQWNAWINRNIFIEEENTEKIGLVISATRTQKVSRKTRECVNHLIKFYSLFDPAPNFSLNDRKRISHFMLWELMEKNTHKTKQNKTKYKRKEELSWENEI